MTIRQWSQAVRLTRDECARIVTVKTLRASQRVVFMLPAAIARTRPRAMLAALEARFPSAAVAAEPGEPIGKQFVRLVRNILNNYPVIKAALKMEVVDA